MARPKINSTALGLALAIIYGVVLFAIGIISTYTGWAKDIMSIYTSFFPGFTPTLTGSVIGLIYGLIFGGILGCAIGILYNYFDRKLKK